MTSGGNPSEFDRFLERELREQVGRLQGPSPRVGQSVYQATYLKGGNWMSFFTTKAGVGLAAAILAVGGGSAAAAAATGSANPGVWGKTVTAAVDSCKDKLRPGEHGIGKCVSAVAKMHGEDERDKGKDKDNHGAASPSPKGMPDDGQEPSPKPGSSAHGKSGSHGHDDTPDPSATPDPNATPEPDSHGHNPHTH